MRLKFDLIRFLIVVFLIFLICVGIYQVYNYLYKAVATEFAVEIACEDIVKTTGYFVRDESVIKSGNSKYIDLVIGDGDKVSKNGTIANVYSSENAAKIQTQIRELQTKIDEFEAVISASSNYLEETSYSPEIKKGILNLTLNASNGEYTTAFESASEFVTSVTKEKIANGEITDYSSKLEQLQDEMKKLKKQSTAVTNYITSASSGYFSYKIDGCENLLNMSMTDDFNASTFENIKNICNGEQTMPNGIGKVVNGSEWRVCFKADSTKFDKIEKGDSINIRIPSVTDSVIKCSVIELFEENYEVYVVLQSNMVTGHLLSQRVCEIDIIIDSHKGLRVDKNALRKIDGVEGVFVKSNGILKYREVDVLYIGSTYAVIKYNILDKSSVQVYDEIVVKGSDLYDKKVIS